MNLASVEPSALLDPPKPWIVKLNNRFHETDQKIDKQLPKRDGSSDRLLSNRGRDSHGVVEAAKPVQVYLLLGGLFGIDGSVTSAGMFQLVKMLQALPNTSVKTYTWDKWRQAYKAIIVNQGKAKIVVIGYSGGGSRATWLANMPARPQIDLLISYDPSPRWQMKPLRENVKKAVCYHNIKTMWLPGLGDLGGGQLLRTAAANVGRKAGANVDIPIHAPSINTIDVAEHHMLVQIDQRLHRHTVEAVRSLAKTAPDREFRLASLARTSPEHDFRSASMPRQASAK